eukprot:4300954-Amphidinium_carterae.2
MMFCTFGGRGRKGCAGGRKRDKGANHICLPCFKGDRLCRKVVDREQGSCEQPHRQHYRVLKAQLNCCPVLHLITLGSKYKYQWEP